MKKYIFDESNGLWDELQGDYYIPCFTLLEVETKEIGVWGMRHEDYLKLHQKALRHFCIKNCVIIQIECS